MKIYEFPKTGYYEYKKLKYAIIDCLISYEVVFENNFQIVDHKQFDEILSNPKNMEIITDFTKFLSLKPKMVQGSIYLPYNLQKFAVEKGFKIIDNKALILKRNKNVKPPIDFSKITEKTTLTKLDSQKKNDSDDSVQKSELDVEKTNSNDEAISGNDFENDLMNEDDFNNELMNENDPEQEKTDENNFVENNQQTDKSSDLTNSSK